MEQTLWSLPGGFRSKTTSYRIDGKHTEQILISLEIGNSKCGCGKGVGTGTVGANVDGRSAAASAPLPRHCILYLDFILKDGRTTIINWEKPI